MPNVITANGIQIETFSEIVDSIVNGTASAPGLTQIYGTDINVASNSPDGQMVNIYALSKQDILNLCVAIYDSFDPDQAVGVALDALSQIAGLARKPGVYTEVVVQVIVAQNLNLDGQDSSTPYTIQDGTGNQFQLIVSASLTTGSNSLNFRAVNIGFIQVLANTLIVPVTIIAGVTSVNNSTTPYQIGANQETDANFRLRRQASTAFPAEGALQALYGGLASLEGIGDVAVYENITNIVDGDGIPAHGIWVVVEGGDADEIGNAIYTYRNLGCPMKGSEVVTITQVDGSTIDMQYDIAVDQNLYIQFHVAAVDGSAIDTDALKQYIVDNYLLGIYEPADISSLDAIILAFDPNLVASSLGVSSLAGYYGTIVYPTLKKNKWVTAVARISII